MLQIDTARPVVILEFSEKNMDMDNRLVWNTGGQVNRGNGYMILLRSPSCSGEEYPNTKSRGATYMNLR